MFGGASGSPGRAPVSGDTLARIRDALVEVQDAPLIFGTPLLKSGAPVCAKGRLESAIAL